MRRLWLAVSAVCGGFGIWATHFIAVLAFAPGLSRGFSMPLTILSLVAAIALTGCGFAMALSRRWPAPWLGGSVAGMGIAVMHYTGMAAFSFHGRTEWDWRLVAVSLTMGIGLAAFALPSGLAGEGRRLPQFRGGALLTAAICGLHFTAMAAASLVPDPLRTIPESAISSTWLALAVATATVAILLLAGLGMILDIHEQNRAELERDHMRGLVNAAMEGLILCDGDRIATANECFARLAGIDIAEAAGTSLTNFLPSEVVTRLTSANASDYEGLNEEVLQTMGQGAVPVELVARSVTFEGKPHRAIAVRDLRLRKKAEADLQYLADHDTLTGLANRRGFNRRLEQEMAAARAEGKGLTLLILDLDRFKEINDQFGHAAGDALLKTVSICIAGVLDDRQTLARIGGDEFGILLPGLTDPALAERIAENILQAFRVENERPDCAIQVFASIGIAVYPADAVDRDSLMSHADIALFRAKSDGRGTFRYFEPEMGRALEERRNIEHDLRQAIVKGEFHLVYQPQRKIATGELIGFEALLRWRSPSRGEVPPDVFIPIAEETNLILQIDDWVLRSVCREAAGWSRPLIVAVNISALQLRSIKFSQKMHEILLETGMPPGRLEIEITETALISDMTCALANLRKIKAFGVRIAMDDFGTGYSSLANLRSFPFDKMKIDRMFVKAVDQNPQSAAIMRAILGLGTGLGLPVLVEGIETSGELKFLAAEACHEGQGYYLGRPGPIEDYLSHVDGGQKPGERPALAAAS